MDKMYYDAASLERVLLAFERRYEMSSAEFYGRYSSDDELPEISRFNQHAWASFYRDVTRLSGGDFAAGAERVLALAD
jgi:hypothetical protein